MSSAVLASLVSGIDIGATVSPWTDHSPAIASASGALGKTSVRFPGVFTGRSSRNTPNPPSAGAELALS